MSDDVDFEFADITIEGETITKVTPAGAEILKGDIIECNGMTLMPGLFDIHIHLALGVLDESQEYSENYFNCLFSL